MPAPFSNVYDDGARARASLFIQLAGLLSTEGRMINLVSDPEIYRHEWASFSTRDFPGNRTAGSGDPVRIIMLDVEGPPARGFAGTATDPAHGRIVLFGDREEMPAAFHDHDNTWELRGRSWIQR